MHHAVQRALSAHVWQIPVEERRKAYRPSALAVGDTEYVVESFAGREGFHAMHVGISTRIVRWHWPEATDAQVADIAIHLPVVNYAKDDRKQATKQIRELLDRNFPVRKPAARKR